VEDHTSSIKQVNSLMILARGIAGALIGTAGIVAGLITSAGWSLVLLGAITTSVAITSMIFRLRGKQGIYGVIRAMR
jgi:hypothetical protein